MKKILIPTDFSEPASIAFKAAYEVAKKYDAELTALHVVEEATHESFRVSGDTSLPDDNERFYTYKLLEQAKKKMEALVNNPDYKDVLVIGELRLGNPFHGMDSIIREHEFDMVVMGTKGHTKIEEMLIGSNTERVVRHCKRPVLTIHQEPTSYQFKNIVYATSLNNDEQQFSELIKKIQQTYGARVHLVRVNTPGDFKRDVVVKKEMLKFADDIGLEDYTINVFNDLTEEEGVIFFADSINADLIAMATHGRTGFAHVLSGSIAEEVVGHSKRPVLSYVLK